MFQYKTRPGEKTWLRTSIGVPLKSALIPSAARSTPNPLPRGKRKQEGLHARQWTRLSIKRQKPRRSGAGPLHPTTQFSHNPPHLSSIAAAVATMLISSASLEGAMTTMLGRHAMKVTSNAPQ